MAVLDSGSQCSARSRATAASEVGGVLVVTSREFKLAPVEWLLPTTPLESAGKSDVWAKPGGEARG